MSLKRSFSGLDLAADARAARARRSAQPSNKEGLEDPTLETPLRVSFSLKDTGLPPSPPAPPIDGRTLFDLETLLIATKMASQMKAEAEAQEAQNATTMKADAEVSQEGLATLAQPLADKTTTDKTSPILNDLGPVALPRIGKKERFSKPCPRHRQAGHRAGRFIKFCSKPYSCECCRGTCQLCEFREDASDERAVALEALPRSRKRSAPKVEKKDLLGPIALPMPCPRHRQAGREAGPHQYLSKPFHCGCCVGTCELCDPTKDPWSPSYEGWVAMLE